MNIILLIAIVILLVICIVLVILLFKKNKNKNNSEIKETNEVTLDKKINLLDLQIPRKIQDMGPHLLFQSCVKVFDSFKVLDYVNQAEKKLDDIEWHSWQISLLLALLQTDKEFFIPNPKKVIHSSIFNRPHDYVENEMQKILNKYEANVDISKSRDELSKDVIWSCKEVSIIFYYMLIRK